MDELLLIIGAAITLMSTTLSFLLTSTYHWMDKNRERNWLIDDRKYQRRLEVLNRRLNEAEKNINLFLDIAEKLIDYEHMLLSSHAWLTENNTNIKDVLEHREKYKLNSSKEITERLSQANRERASIFNLNDEELIKLTADLGTAITEEMDIVDSLERKINNSEIINIEVEQKRIFYFNNKTLEIRKKAISRIDHLAGFQL